MPDSKSSESKIGMIGGLQPIVTLGMIANTVQSFSGKEKVEEYFEKIEQRSKLDDWDESTTLKIIKFRLTGDAYKFYKSDKNLMSDTINYAEFKSKFIKKFSPVSIPGENLIKLGKTFQRHDESVSQFVIRLKGIGNDILTEDLKQSSAVEHPGITRKCNELVLNQFKIGIKKEYMKSLGPVLMRERDLTIDRAEELAKQEELSDIMLKSRNNNMNVFSTSARFTCFNCGKQGHNSKNCRNFNSNFNQNFNRNQNNVRQQFPRNNTNYQQRNASFNFNRPPNFTNPIRMNQFRHNFNFNNYNPQMQNQHNFRQNQVNSQGYKDGATNRNNRSFNYQANFTRDNNQQHPQVSVSNPLNAKCPPFIPRTGGKQ